MKKRILRLKKNLNSTKGKTEISIFVLHTHVIYIILYRTHGLPYENRCPMLAILYFIWSPPPATPLK